MKDNEEEQNSSQESAEDNNEGDSGETEKLSLFEQLNEQFDEEMEKKRTAAIEAEEKSWMSQ